MNEDLERALALVDQLAAKPSPPEQDVLLLVWGILSRAGYAVGEPNFEGDPGYDFSFRGQLDGAEEHVAVEIKGGKGPVSGQTMYKLLDARRRGRFDRMLVIGLGSFSKLATDRAKSDSRGKIDLLTPDDLRSWLRRHAEARSPRSLNVATLIRNCMQAVARRIAQRPEELGDVEWRDLERLLREVFEGLGFETELTRSTKDGGIDLRLTAGDKTYLVEVKHWQERVGPGPVNKLIKVAAREEAAASLLLSSSGFTQSMFEGVLEVGPPTHLGDGGKIIGLCRVYYRLGSELLQADHDLPALLLQDTVKVPEFSS